MKSVFVCFPLRDAGLDIIRASFPDAEVWGEESVCPYEVAKEKAGQFRALITAPSMKIDEGILNHDNLVIVSQSSAGFDNIDIETATKHKVLISNTADALTDTVADLAWGLLLASARHIVAGANFVQENKWTHMVPNMFFGADVSRKTIGIIGAGRIGQAIGRRGLGFDMKILYTGPHQKPEFEEKGAEYRTLSELLNQSDFVVAATPLSPSTHHLMGSDQFSQMKKSAIFVNIGRGGVVNSEALAHALKNGIIAGAALDVVDNEPISGDHCLIGLNNCIIVPHMASATIETRDRMAVDAANAVVDALHGRSVKTLTNRNVSLDKVHAL